MEEILIKSVERETGIVYVFLISREDGEKIIENEGAEMIEIDRGYASFRNGNIEIKEGASRAFLEVDEVMSQIKSQL
jgi:hypothetical protein